MCPARGHRAAAGLALALAQAPGDCQEGRIPQPPELAQTRAAAERRTLSPQQRVPWWR